MNKMRALNLKISVGGLLLLLALCLFAVRTPVDAATATNATVTATSLNVRKSASASSTSLGKIQKGTQVTIVSKKKDSKGGYWYKVKVLISEKTVQGYVHEDYIEMNPVYDYIKTTGATNATNLNIRKSTSTSSKTLAKVSKGTRVTIIGEKTVNGTKWIKLTLTVNGKKITGYTHSKYVTRDKTTASSEEYLFGIAKADNTVVYSKANTYTKIKAKLVKNQEVIILNTFKVNGTTWYRVKVKMNASNVYGYVKASKITKKTATVASTENLKATISTKTGAYKIASKVAGKIETLSVGKSVTVKGTLTVNSVKWYLCKFTVSGTSYTGYIPVSCVQLDSEAATNATVTATSLNVRKSASTSSASLGKIQKGTQVTIVSKKKDSKGSYWYKVKVLISEKTVQGYVHEDYIEMNPVYDYIETTGATNATSLNIRKSTSTSSKILAKVSKGTRVTIIGEKTVKGTKWIKLTLTVNGKKITGYTHSEYVTRDKITASSEEYLFGIAKADNTVVYSKANIYTDIKAKLVKNQEVIILNTFKVNGTSWYRVKVKMNATNVYGYVIASKITKKTATVASTENLKATISTKTGAYKIASKVAGKIETLSVGKSVTVKGTLTVNSVKWYRCNFTVSGTSYTAYIPASCVQIDSEAAFEQSIAGFPESYKASLRTLHEKYPNWTFVPLNTGLDWNAVIQNESKVGKNTIQSNVPKGGSVSSYSFPFSYLSTDAGAYNWATDTYTLIDGSNWYTADKEVIEYYMDPRNSLTVEKIWQFETLAYDDKQDIKVVQKILDNTFMSGDYSCIDSATNKKEKGNYASTFMEVGKLSGASPYFLAARAKQELGSNGSGSVSGKYPGYEGIYNFFNIGANDSSTGQAIANGLKWASTGSTYLRPWTSIYKAIYGGAQYITTSYINKGQNTLYLQKFNVVYAPLYSHQYMTNVMAPTSEAKTQYNSYNKLSILDGKYVFYIPVYKNMPSSAASLPASSGNPNSYLKSLTATYGGKTISLTPTFHYQTTSYTMVVDSTVDQIKIGGSAVSKHGSVSGLGTYSLKAGKTTTIKIKCTAGNGTSTTYTLKVSRLAS